MNPVDDTKNETVGPRPTPVDGTMPTPVTAEKKPFYKKWWFWVIVIIVALSALGSDPNASSSTSSAPNATESVSATPTKNRVAGNYIDTTSSMPSILMLNRDGSAFMQFIETGNKRDGTWELKDGTHVIVYVENAASSTFRISGNQLIEAEYGFVFKPM